MPQLPDLPNVAVLMLDRRGRHRHPRSLGPPMYHRQMPKTTNTRKFMNVMKPKKVPVWANEATAEPQILVSTEHASATQGELSDAEWLKQRMSSAVDVEEKVFEQSDDEDAPKAKSAQPVSSLVLSLSASSYCTR